MGSAEASGVSGKGFDVAKRLWPFGATIRFPLPIACFFLTAFLAALCFIVYDMARTASETEARARLAATLAAAQISAEAPAAAFSLPPALDKDLHFTISDEDGQIVWASHPSSRLDAARLVDASVPLAHNNGQVTVSVMSQPVGLPLAVRLLIALAATAALTSLFGLLWARREGSDILPPIEAVPHGLAHWSEDGLLVCANSAFARLLRLDRGPLRPGTAYGAVSRNIVGKIAARPVLDAQRQRTVEIEYPDGRTVLLDERPCASGGFITIVTDITERKAADTMLSRIREEQKLLARRYHEEKIRAEASSRAKTSFLAHLSHDVRTPLNHIIGFADLIRLETFGPLGDPKYRSYLDDIKCAGEQLLGSFAEILEFAELESGRKSLKRERLAICDLLDDTLARFSTRARNAGVDLKIGPVGAGEVLADRHYLDRMFANLLDNALRFTGRGGSVRLAAWVADGGVVLEVTDTGVGMSREQMDRLSQPFVLTDSAFTRDHRGIGLGIATARAIVELNGGRLALDSLEGIGTTVAVSLPLAPSEDAPLPVSGYIPARAA